ncbi:MAG TPA: hypothetical protein VFG81_02355 [Anaerolineales bacterium]|jgi:hypothetical protein|nr:hypothetical protein [Anaerolineales bacterium]
MRTVLNIIGILLLLGGGILFVLGFNILPSGFPAGNPQSAINGSSLMILAFILIIWVNRN